MFGWCFSYYLAHNNNSRDAHNVIFNFVSIMNGEVHLGIYDHSHLIRIIIHNINKHQVNDDGTKRMGL